MSDMAGTTDRETEQSFRQMWIDAQLRFEDTTKQTLLQGRCQGLDDVLQQLDKRLNGDDDVQSSKKQRVKELTSNVLTFIRILSGIAAQGASVVFSPATLCFNALQFLINIPSRISKFYDDLARLFEEISTFMQQFKVYKRIERYASVGIELKENTHKLLINFVDICAISIDVLSGSKLKRSRTWAKIALFENDSGIGAKLEEFRRLVDHQSRISDAITLEHILKSKSELSSSIENVLEVLYKASDDSKRLLEEKSQEIQNELKDAHDDLKEVKEKTETLMKENIDRSSIKKQQEDYERILKKLPVAAETVQKLEKDIEQIRSDSLQGTGSWLDKIEVYRLWSDFTSHASSLLWLSGSTGSGKSRLGLATLERLKFQYSSVGNNSMRLLTASYSFVRNDKQFRENAIKDSLKAMAAQMAKQSNVYARKLSSDLESKASSFLRDMKIEDIPAELFPPPTLKDSFDTAYILLFDGLDQLSLDDANLLMGTFRTMQSPKIRIIVAGTDDILLSSLNSIGKNLESVPGINIVDHNETDIKSFIESELNKYKVLKSDAPEILKIKNAVREKLPEAARGNFSDVHRVIERVNEAVEADSDSVEDIISLISVETLQDRNAATERLIQELNESLTAQEIEQLNEILIWTIYGCQWLSVPKMRAALFLRTKRIPLQSLEDKVKQKYSKLLRVNRDDGTFELKNSFLDDYFRASKWERQETDTEGGGDHTISMNIKIDHVKVSQVQRFFWDLSEKVVLERFAFSGSLSNSARSTKVSASRVEGHMVLVRRCFELLLEEPNEKTKTLGEYAMLNLFWHLSSLKDDIKDIASEEGLQIVDDLLNLLQSVDSIESHLTTDFFEYRSWLDETFDLPALQAWLVEFENNSKLSRKAKNFLKHVKSDGKLSALKDTAKLVARHWLCRRDWQAHLPFRWIDAYLDKLLLEQQSNSLTDKSRSNHSSGTDLVNASTAQDTKEKSEKEVTPIQTRIIRAVAWAEDALKANKDSFWFERLGETYLLHEELNLSKQAFLNAKDLPNPSPWVFDGLARLYAVDDKNMAIKEMEKVFDQLDQKALDTKHRSLYLEGLNRAAAWHSELNNTADAIEKYRKAIEVDEHYYQSHYGILKIYVDGGQLSEAVRLLEDMRTQHPKENSNSQLESMLLTFSTWDEPLHHFETILEAVRGQNEFLLVLETLQIALQRARDDKSIPSVIDLLLYCGVAQTRYSIHETSVETAIAHWSECCELGFQSENSEKWASTISAAKYVFNHYFSSAQSINSSTTQADIFKTYETKLKELSDSANSFFGAITLRLLLASFYVMAERQEMARGVLLNDMKSALELLSDDDPANDYMGYNNVANILMHSGDDLNALSAWSLLGPLGRFAQDGTKGANINKTTSSVEDDPNEDSTFSCDGQCNIKWTRSDQIWFCKVCDNVNFDDACLAKVKAGTLNRFVCSPDHQWLLVPSWNDEYKATGKGNVRIGGVMEDGKRVGGRVVTIAMWLDMIREKWGIERPKAEIQDTSRIGNK